MIQGGIKSRFLVPAIVCSLVLAFLSLVFALRGAHDSLAWWGAVMAAMPLPLTLLYLKSAQRARVSENAPLAILFASAGVMLSGWEWLMEGVANWWPFGAALAGFSLLSLYVFWYARYGRITSSQLDVGAKLPQFDLQDVDGNAVSSSKFAGRPTVFLFYRGNWCPLCMAQVAEIAARHEEFERLGIAVALISSQPVARTRELAARHAVSLDFLVDTDNKAATSLDLVVRNGFPAFWPGDYPRDTVMPTVIVTNANGTIVFSDQTDNYRLRPEPDIFLAILRRAGALAT